LEIEAVPAIDLLALANLQQAGQGSA